jgi:hypothetical protein
MHGSHSRGWICAALAWLLLPAAASADDAQPPAVGFAAGYEATLQAKYGTRETAALRSQMLAAVSESLQAAHGSCQLHLDVVLERAAPSHPTMQQQLNDPALDPFHSVYFNGGAALSGQVRDAHGQVLASVTHRRFADDRSSLSASRDPWSDADVAIGQFADKLVRACRRQTITGALAQHAPVEN